MRILLAAYFFSPLQNVAAERWKRFSTQLAKKGHELTVLTGPWAQGTSSGADRIRIHYLEDSRSEDSRRLRGAAAASRTPLPQRIKALLPTFLLVDGKWSWSLRAAREVESLSKSPRLGFDLAILTGTPWSTVAAFAEYCRHRSIPYVIDFRDLWADEPYLRLSSPLARKYFRFLESRAIKGAAGIITVNDTMAEAFRGKAPGIPVASFPNGYDGILSDDKAAFTAPRPGVDLLTYAGSTSPYSAFGDFLTALSTVDGGRFLASLGFLGDDPMGDLTSFPAVRHRASVPAGEALEVMKGSNVLLLTLAPKAQNYTTGKLMSYVAAQRPILYYGPAESPAADLIRRHGLGWVVANGDTASLARVMAEISARTEAGQPFPLQPDIQGLKAHSAERIGDGLSGFIEEVRHVRHSRLS